MRYLLTIHLDRFDAATVIPDRDSALNVLRHYDNWTQRVEWDDEDGEDFEGLECRSGRGYGEDPDDEPYHLRLYELPLLHTELIVFSD